MKKSQFKISLEDKTTKWVVKLYDDPTVPNTLKCRANQLQFLKDLADQPALLKCGPTTFQKFSMTHNGECWVVEMETIVED